MVFVIATILLFLSLGAAYQALLLIPTELGYAYMNGAFISGAAGLVSLALGFAARSLRLAILQRPAAHMAEGPQPGDTAAMAEGRPDRMAPVLDRPSMAGGSMPGSELAMAGLAGAGMAAAGAAAAKAALAEEAAMALPTKSLDEIERDLFADLAPASATRADEAPPAKSASPAAAEDTIWDEITGPPEAGQGVELRKMQDEMAESSAEMAPFDPAPITLPPRIIEPDLVEAPRPEAAPMGLIPDEDLAALQAEEPPLAPLDHLDIVGSYDSGGTRFTMYSDGSVLTTGPEGERRFRDLDALRRHIDGGARGMARAEPG